jgi:dephospho-CoA kinase
MAQVSWGRNHHQKGASMADVLHGESPVRAIALVGMAGSGKSICCEHLEKRGFYKFRFGQIIVDEVGRRGMPLTPENERTVRENLRASSINAIAELALPYLNQALQTHNTIVIDGLYGFGEYKLLNQQLNARMVVVAVACDKIQRYERLAQRPVRPLTPQQAAVRDYAEIEYLEKGGPIAIADYTLLNNAAPEDLLRDLDTLLASLALNP